jgi:hypothetical protein
MSLNERISKVIEYSNLTPPSLQMRLMYNALLFRTLLPEEKTFIRVYHKNKIPIP